MTALLNAGEMLCLRREMLRVFRANPGMPMTLTALLKQRSRRQFLGDIGGPGNVSKGTFKEAFGQLDAYIISHQEPGQTGSLERTTVRGKVAFIYHTGEEDTGMDTKMKPRVLRKSEGLTEKLRQAILDLVYEGPADEEFVKATVLEALGFDSIPRQYWQGTLRALRNSKHGYERIIISKDGMLVSASAVEEAVLATPEAQQAQQIAREEGIVVHLGDEVTMVGPDGSRVTVIFRAVTVTADDVSVKGKRIMPDIRWVLGATTVVLTTVGLLSQMV